MNAFYNKKNNRFQKALRSTAVVTALVMAGMNSVFAQSLANYSISRSTSITYNSISYSGNSVATWRNSDQWTADDNRSYPIPIGFDFWYNGVRYTELSISINGFADFSSSSADGTIGSDRTGRDYDSDNPSHNRLSNTTGLKAWNALAPIYGDMSTQNQEDPLGTSFKYLTSGVQPNRVFTVEWINLSVWDQINSGTSYNFQIKLYESSGVIEFVYGDMTAGSATLQYKCGINAADLSGGLSSAVLRIQYSPNSTDFRPQRNLSSGNGYTTTLPTSNSMLTFTPNIPNTPTSLSFSSVTTSSMTLNWTDNASNEIGYIIYRSTDGANYYFVRQLAANSTSSNETGLAAGVTYYWKVYAVTEGGLSSVLSGSQKTTDGASAVSVATGNWSTGSTWQGGSVPLATDNVTISTGTTVYVDQNVTANKIKVDGTLVIGNNATARSLAITDSITVSNGGTFTVNTAYSQSGHTITTSGSILNNGVFNLGPSATSRCAITFNRAGNQTVGGNGTTTQFYLMTLDMGSSNSNILDIFSNNFSTQSNGFLTITNGTFRFSSPNTITPFTSNTTIPTTGQLWINNSSAVVNTTGGNLTLSGPLRVTNGTLNIGNASNNNLIANGGLVWIEDGAINVAGRFEEYNVVTISKFKMNGGSFTVNTTGSTSTSSYPFNISVVGGSFTQTAGTIVVQRAGSNNLGYRNTGSVLPTITGGAVQMGNGSTPASTIMRINSKVPVYNLVVQNGAGANTAQLDTNHLTVKNDVTITSGTLNANNLNMFVGRNWSNSGTFTTGTGKVTFNGSSAQSISKTGGETFNKLAIEGSGNTISLSNNVAVNDSFQLTSGTLSVGTNTLTLNGIVTDGGILTSSVSGTVSYNRSANTQSVIKANYGNLTFNNYRKVLPSDIVGVAGTFTPGNAAPHTVTGNTIEFNAAGAQNIPSFQYNNLTLSNSGTKTLQSGADTVLGNLTINSGTTLADNGITLRVNGDILNNGAHSGSGRISLTGSTLQTISGSASFNNLEMNSASGAAISGSQTITGTLTLTNGVIRTYTDTLIISSSGSVSRTSGHIAGWLQKYVNTGTSVSVLYELGDTTGTYAPATFVFATVSTAGTLTVSTVSTEHPDVATSFINVANNVNRYWATRYNNLTFTGNYTLTLQFVAGDCDIGGNAGFRTNIFDGSSWTSATAGSNTVTTNQSTGNSVLGSYAVGMQDAANAYRTKASGYFDDYTTVWERYNGTSWVAATRAPRNADDQITVKSGHTITVRTNLSGGTSGVDQVLIEAGGKILITTGGTLEIRNGAGDDLIVYGDLEWAAGTFSINGGATRIFKNGSRYIHNVNNQTIPSATWEENSTIEIKGITGTVPAGRGQTFGNFIWNCAGQTGTIAFGTTIPTINGNFEVWNTNGQQVQLTTTSTTYTINKNFIVTGGNVVLITGGASLTVNGIDTLKVTGGNLIFRTNASNGTITMNVANAVLLSGGTIDMTQRNNAGSYGTINLSGDLRLTGGTLTETGSSYGQIVLNGSDVQSYTGGTTVNNDIRFTVNSGAKLAMGTEVLDGSNATFTLNSGGTLLIGSTAGIMSSGTTGNIQTNTRTFNSGAYYVYNGTTAQNTGTGLPSSVNKLIIDNAAGVTQTASSVTVTDSLNLLNGTYNVSTNTLLINNVAYQNSGNLSSSVTGTVNYNKSSNGQNVLIGSYGNLTLSNYNKIFPSATIGIAGTFTTGNATGHTMTGNTIDFNYSGTQTIDSWQYYNNVIVSGSYWKAIAGNVTVNGDLTISGATLSDSSYTLSVKGNISNSSTITGTTGVGKTLLTGGSSSHTISGGGTYNDLELNDVNGAAISGNITINNIFTLTSGILTAANDTVICNSTTGISRPGSGGHINGYLRKNIAVSGVAKSYMYEIGDASNYTPVEVTFESVTTGGTLTAHQTPIEHPQIKLSGIDKDLMVNRYYSLIANGIAYSSYSATYNYVTSDIDAGANTAYFFVKRNESSFWKPTSISQRSATYTSITGTVGIGDFAVGELSNIFYWTKGAGTYNWGDDDNWSSNNVPTLGNNVYLDGKDTIQVNVNAVCKNLTLINDTLRLTMLAGKTLTVDQNLTQYSGEFSTRGAFPTVSGILSLNGGLFGYDSSAGSQTVKNISYQKLRLSGGGTKTAAGAFTVNKNLSITGGVIFADGGYTITVKDSITNNGNHTGIGKILLDGTTQHQITGTGSFTNLQLNNSSNGINLDSNITINGVLTLTSGIITAPNDTLFISSTGSIARTSGHINGNLRKYFSNAADSLTFEIGNATSYLPVTVSFGTISANGNLTVQMVGTEHPDISNSSLDPDSTINRYWILNNNGIAFDKYNITVNWLNTDVDNGINDFSDMLMAIKSNGVWDELESGVITSTSMRGMNGTSFSSFAVGKVSSRLFTSVATGNWNTGGTWDRGSVPKKRDHVKIVSPHVVTLTDTRKISNVEIQSGAEFADGGKLLQMYGNFKFSGKWSGSGTIEWYDGSDTLSGSGGKATGTSTLSIQASNRYITATNDTLYKILIPSAYTVTNLGTVRATRVIGSVAGATWVNDVNSSLSVADTLLATGTLTATANGNTIIYNGTGAQSVKAANYKNLTISGARTTNSITLLTGTAGVSGVFTPSATFTTGNYITTSNTIDFNGTDAQAIPAFSYNNLTISGARTTNSVTLVSGDTIKIAGTFAPSATFTSGNYVTTNNWVSFNSAGAQTIPAFNYNSLKITGGRTTNNVTLASSDTIGVADSLSLQATFTTGKYIITGSKIAYNGTGKQNIVPFNYNNLSISGARGSNNVIFSPTGTVGVAGVLSNSASFSGGGLVFTNSTVDYNGTGAQTVPAFNYHHLTISGARTTNSVTLAPSTIGIAGTFSPTATFTTGNFVTTSNTISFNGSGAQNIPAFKYGNLGTATGGTKTATGTIRVEGDFTIGSSTTFNASTTTDTIYGNWTNSGTFTPSTSTIVFAGNSSSTISGSSTFNNLVMNKVDSATAVNLASNIQTANITMTKGTVQTGSNALTITTTRSGNGIIIGTVTRTHTFNLSTPYAFEGPNTLITFTAGTTPSSVTVTTTQTTPVSPSFIAVDRSFTIAMTGGSGLTTTLRLHYENSETNQLNEMAMDLWRHTSSWNNQNSTTNDSVNNYIELTGIATVTGDWAIGSSSSTKSVSDMNGGVTNAGDSLLYTITIKNPYKITKSSINVTDPINSYLIVKAGTISHGGGITGQTVNGNGSLVGGTVSWSAFSLASGDSAKRTFIVNSDSTMNVSELITNTASIDYGGSQIEYVTVPITITNVANIIIDTNIVSNSTPVPGDTLIYTLKYRNSGTSMAKTVGLTYTVPSNTSFVTNAFGSGKGIEINGVGKTNTSDGDEASISGLNITVSFTTLQPGDYKIVKFKTIVN